MYACLYLFMFVCMDGWMYVWMDGWMHAWIGGWMDGKITGTYQKRSGVKITVQELLFGKIDRCWHWCGNLKRVQVHIPHKNNNVEYIYIYRDTVMH